MNKTQLLAETPAVVLVGGLGTRLRPVVSSTPKALARIGETTIIELLIHQLKVQGIRKIVLCTGHLGEQIEKALGSGREFGVKIRYSREQTQLGTGGALKHAESSMWDAPDFLVMNGDSLIEVDFAALLNFHAACGGVVTLSVCSVEDASRYGTVKVSTNNRVTSFEEKAEVADSGRVSAGVYAFSRSIFQHLVQGPSSLEREVFPRVLDKGVYAFQVESMFIDIGTPEDFDRAQTLAERLLAAAARSFR